jgi:Zn-dependent protease with chaperone function
LNFFEHQDAARRASRRLIWLFALSIVVIVVAIDLLVGAALGWVGMPVDRVAYLWITVLAVTVILGGSLWQIRRLAGGGEVVAAQLGGRAVDPSTGDLLERRLLNVVEEMALAAGVPVPRCYLLEHQRFINACAAGNSLADAAVIVTRGALTRLSRDELQGVIAHEFSHIVNGDMRLNLRLVGVVFGLLLVSLTGQKIIENGAGNSDDIRASVLLLLLGAGLYALGYLGVLCARSIKAAISRGREYLADASAVQFTRNPDGIGGALRKIGGLGGAGGLGAPVVTERGEIAARLAGVVRADEERTSRSSAETYGHMFIAPAARAFAAGVWSTHPPLAERVRRIYGRTMEWLHAPEQPVLQAFAPAPAPRPPLPYPAGSAADVASPVAALVAHGPPYADDVVPAVGAAPGVAAGRALIEQLDTAPLAQAVADSTRAPLLALALLIEKGSAVDAQQRQAIAEALGAPAVAEVDALHQAVQALAPGLRLPLLDRAAPALRKLPASSGERLLRLAHVLIAADGRVTLPEFLLYTALARRVGPQAAQAPAVRFRTLAPLAAEAALVLALLAQVRAPEAVPAAFAAGARLLPEIEVAVPPAVTLDGVRRALERLAQLAPLAKPAFIKACAAVVFYGGTANWQAASALRTVCAALDAPLPPQMETAPLQ